MAGPLLIVIIGFCGLALDLGQLYNRKVDLTGIAKTVALAAARELNGTPEGITSAKAKAKETAERFKYQNFGAGISFTWSDDALSFGKSSSRSGTWTPASSIGAGSVEVPELYFAKVDTAGLDKEMGQVNTFIMRIFSSSLSTIQMYESAVAGRTSVKVTPIAVCAMSTDKATARTFTSSSGTTLTELVQYGFRRGVSYNLMQLNPNGTAPARFEINPVASPNAGGAAFNSAGLWPFMCSGTMWVPRLMGGTIRVTELPSTSPLGSYYRALNSRLDIYAGGPCHPNGAPPDINVKQYTYDVANVVKWMTPVSGKAAAATTTERGKLETIADLPTPPASMDPGDYGPLWAYAKAAKAPSPLDTAEPAGGFAVFSASDWPTLYKFGPTGGSYPTSPPTPYQSGSSGSGYFQSPTAANKPIAMRYRRVLNIPLLSCTAPAPSGANANATVLSVAKFFMTVPATQDSLIAEFGGLASEQSQAGQVELYP
jgi:hypothetical protein